MQCLNYQVKLYSIFFNIDLKCEALNFSSLTDGWPLTPHTVCWDCLVDDKHLSQPHSRMFVLRWIHKYMMTLFNAYLATSQPINSSQTATLSISTLSCQTRKARRTAPAPIMQLTGVIISLSLQFAFLLTSGFTFPVRSAAAHSLLPKSFIVMTTAAWFLQQLCHVYHVLE